MLIIRFLFSSALFPRRPTLNNGEIIEIFEQVYLSSFLQQTLCSNNIYIIRPLYTPFILNGESRLIIIQFRLIHLQHTRKPLHLHFEVFSIFNLRNNKKSNRKMRRLLGLNPPLISNCNLHALDHAIKKKII